MAKKICYVTTIAGTLGFFTKQLLFLSENGFDVTVISSDDGRLPQELVDTVRYIPVDIPRGVAFFKSFSAIKQLEKIFREEQFDLIQYSTPNAAFYSSIAAKKAGCKVRNYHLMGLRYLGASGIGRMILKGIEKTACKNSTSIECVSNSNMEMGIREGLFNGDKVTVVWNGSSGGVDCNRFDFDKRCEWRQEVRNELGYSQDDFVYGFVGRITRDKGINELIEAYFNLDCNDKLFIIGRLEDDGTLNQKLISRARLNQNIIFHDAVTDIERYYAAIDVLILPSYREGFGNVVIEAGAVGTPAIVSNIPGPIDTIDKGKTALTVEVKNVVDLTSKMKDIRTLDYRNMGHEAAQYARERFDSDILCEKIMERKIKLILEKT